MRRLVFTIAMYIVLIPAASFASAEDGVEVMFGILDGNNDGCIDQHEIVHHAVTTFVGLDREGDGVLDKAELEAQDAAAVSAADRGGKGLHYQRLFQAHSPAIHAVLHAELRVRPLRQSRKPRQSTGSHRAREACRG